MKIITSIDSTVKNLANKVPESFIILVGRLAIASVFWRSVQTKITGWEVAGQSFKFFDLSPSTIMLFRYEYQLPLVPYQWAAYAGTFAEYFFALFLALGLATRYSALGLLGVTAVIQFLVFPDAWPTHILWFAILLYVFKNGGGNLSLDYLIATSKQ